jgi:hypothetical protein
MPKSQPYLEAEQKIAEALQSGATELDLHTSVNMGAIQPPKLTELPELLGELTQIKSLNLSNNELKKLPKWFNQLTQLTSLNLSSNQLTTLPPSLGQLTQLAVLNLSINQLTTHAPKRHGQRTGTIRHPGAASSAQPTRPHSGQTRPAPRRHLYRRLSLAVQSPLRCLAAQYS